MTHAGTTDLESPALAQIPFTSLAGFSELYRTYCESFEELSAFYPRDWRSPADLADAAREAAARPRDRETLVAVLRRQQGLWGKDPEADRQVERLLDPTSSVIVTGQQVGLFTGPIYTVLKAITTLQLARKLESETGDPVVPVFWLGSEDHDFAEMAGVGLPDGAGVRDLRYEGHVLPEEGNLGPVGMLPFGEDIERVIGEVDALLPPSDFHAPLLARLRECYRPGVTFRDAFGSFLRSILPGTGLVLMSADDPELKRLASPLWRRELQEWKTLADGLADSSARLAERFHAQVHIRPSNLFLLENGQRLPIDASGDGFKIRGTDVSFSEAGLLALLETEPERFSPNVVLRPLTQDWLLPTAAYIAGPGEAAYFGQYQPAYAWAQLPMPVIYPRVSVSVVERRIRKSLDRLGRPLNAFSGELEPLFTSLVKEQLAFDLDAEFGKAQGAVHRMIGELKPVISEIDRSLGKTLEASRAALLNELGRLKDRVVRSERRSQDELREQVLKVRGALFPDGKLQERVISPLFFLNKYGPDFFLRLLESLPVETGAHVIVEL